MPQPRDYTDEELIEMLREFAKELGETPTIQQIQENDTMPSRGTYAYRFGSYGEACLEAGIEPNQAGGAYPREALIRELMDFAKENGRVPKQADLEADDDLPSAATFSKRFGSLREAFAAAMVWSSTTSVEVSRYSGTETTELDRGEDLDVRGETVIVSVRNNY